MSSYKTIFLYPVKSFVMQKKILTSVALYIIIFFNQAYSQQPGLNWVKHIGAANEGFVGVAMAVDSDKYIIVAGDFRGTADFDEGTGVFNMTSNGDQDLFITKYDSAGNFIWAKHIGGLLGDQVRELKLDRNGNIIIMGMFQGTVDMDPGPGTVNATAIGSDAFVIKLDNSGNYIWSKQWQVYSINTMEIDNHNNIILGGDFGGPADFDPGPNTYTLTAGNVANDLFICKIDENGIFKWAKQMPNLGNAQLQEFTMESDSKENIYMAGNFSQSMDFDPGINTFSLTSNGGDDGFAVKLDSNGNFSWAKQFGGSGTDKVWSVEIDNDDKVLLTGQYNGTVDFDPGVPVFNLSNTSNRGCFIVKLENDGGFIFAKTFAGEAFGESITVDSGNNIYISGGFYNSVDFDPGPADNSLADGNIFIVKLNESGNFTWAVQFQNAILGSYESIYCKIKVDALKNIYYTGMFPFAVDFDPNPSSQNIISPYGTSDVPIVKLNGGICQTPTNNISASFCDSYTFNGISYTSSGTYQQHFTNGNGCDSLIVLHLTVYTKSQPDLGKDTTICSNHPFSISPGNFNSYLWSDGTINNTLNITQPGNYWVNVTDNNNCQMRDSINIIPAAGCDDNLCELTAQTIFYPNPVENLLTINKNNTSCIVKMNLYNAIGQLLLKDFLLYDGINSLDFSKYPSGVYFYKLHTGQRILKNGKIEKK